MNGSSNPAHVGMNNHNPIRPPTGPGSSVAGMGVRPPLSSQGFGSGQPGFNAGVGAGRGGAPTGSARGGTPVPVSRPPIHMGLGVPSGPAAFGRGGASSRGGMANRGGRGGGIVNAPRGPSGMRRADGRASVTPRRSDARADREKEKDKKRKEKESKTTMTDFRIVGIEIKALDWSWGIVGTEGDAETEVKQKSQNAPNKGENGDAGTSAAEQDVEGSNGDTASVEPNGEAVEGQVPVKAEADTEAETSGDTAAPEQTPGTSAGANAVETVEEKRGEKRKAKTPDAGVSLRVFLFSEIGLVT